MKKVITYVIAVAITAALVEWELGKVEMNVGTVKYPTLDHYTYGTLAAD